MRHEPVSIESPNSAPNYLSFKCSHTLFPFPPSHSLSRSLSFSTSCLLPVVRRQREGSLGKAEAASLCDTNRLLHYQTPSVATSELTRPCTYLSHLLSAEAPINVVNVVYKLTVWHNAQ